MKQLFLLINLDCWSLGIYSFSWLGVHIYCAVVPPIRATLKGTSWIHFMCVCVYKSETDTIEHIYRGACQQRIIRRQWAKILWLFPRQVG